MHYIPRLLEAKVQYALSRNKSVLLLGARQTGKTTLVNRFAYDLLISFVQPAVRQRYEKLPQLLAGEIEALKLQVNRRPLVVLDEVQKVPVILDVVQDLIDRNQANFILTGSSARKLRGGAHMNWLPGRVVVFKLDPLTLLEFPDQDLNERLYYGALPGVVTVPKLSDRTADLEAYVTTYLEEEIRSEAVVRNLGNFARYLELAASESGNITNFRKLSHEIGVSHTTIGSYYQILEDCLIAEKVEPLTHSKTRKKLTKSPKYLFFDLGVRRLAAREGTKLPRDILGRIFEQFVGLELIRQSRIVNPGANVLFWRDPDGPEIDWIIESEHNHIPVEVKLTDRPSKSDIRHMEVFLAEHKSASIGYLVCQVPRRTKLSEKIFALPWQSLNELMV